MSPSERKRNAHPGLRQRVGVTPSRRARQELTERLMAEYAGALPPGQIVAAVTRAGLVLRAAGLEGAATWASTCEEIARRALAEGVAQARRVPASAGASAALQS